VKNIRDFVECDEDDALSSGSTPSPTLFRRPRSEIFHQSFFFQRDPGAYNLEELHPLPSQIPFMWQKYVESVDPLVKILHVPSMNKTLREMDGNVKSLAVDMEAVMFSVYLAAVASLNEEEAG